MILNAKSKTLDINDQPITERAQLESFSSLYEMKHLIIEPSQVLENSSSFIDLIPTNQPNLIMGSGVHLTLHPRCHHQIICSNLIWKQKQNILLFMPVGYGIMVNPNRIWLIQQLKTLIGKNFSRIIIFTFKLTSLIGQYWTFPEILIHLRLFCAMMQSILWWMIKLNFWLSENIWSFRHKRET